MEGIMDTGFSSSKTQTAESLYRNHSQESQTLQPVIQLIHMETQTNV
jgi:hypothetical protein